ncbi:hypothetical protein SASPL_120471 [Salvia splendens]|uniref:Uncharacterized protein n=1 Tax=Salvia splendens TaxID=180675 RepID=A0A8X8XQK6_SALSN|nr:hypothetical protein SASPL_120471 [Salvia splendens]
MAALSPKPIPPCITLPPSTPPPNPPPHSPSSPVKRPHSSSPMRRRRTPGLTPSTRETTPRWSTASSSPTASRTRTPALPTTPGTRTASSSSPGLRRVEVASLCLKIRGDVRRCCCVISGGVYDNLLFFPAIQMIKDRYPGVQVDIVTTARGKQVYEINKNVRFADVYDVDDPFPEPAEYTDMIGQLKNRYYDMILSTKLAGIGHGAFLFMASARDVVSYVYPNVNAAGAGLFLSETFTPATTNLADGGVASAEGVDFKEGEGGGRGQVHERGGSQGRYIVIHGIKSDSKASMQSKGDTDSLLPIEIWDDIASAISGLTPLFVIPHEKERENVEYVVGDDASIVFITTPGQLAALINDSAGVICSNTAAVQLANAREKPSIALFCSEDKAKVFVPNAEEKRCAVISSKTGKLVDIDVEAVKTAVQIFSLPLAIA